MPITPKKKAPTFGEFIASVYNGCGRQKAKGIVRLAVNARLIEFRGLERYEISPRRPARHLAIL